MKARVLVVDDSSYMRTVIKDFVQKAGHDVIGEAESGKEAVEKCKELKPDLVILDIVMPGMDGIATLNAIKESGIQTKVVMCSAMGQERLMNRAREAGALGFIVKPFKVQQFLEALKEALGD